MEEVYLLLCLEEYSGMSWILFLEEIEKIEVIRGPGAAIWGTNAVNGVINIITKSSADSQGLEVSLAGGTELQTSNTLRYGGKLSENAFYKIYGKYSMRDESGVFDEIDPNDDTDTARGGFRVDWVLSERNKLMLQGEGYWTEANSKEFFSSVEEADFFEEVLRRNENNGGHFLVRWDYMGESSESYAQFYYDRSERDQVDTSSRVDTLDIELQNSFSLLENSELTWGGSYRFYHDGSSSSTGGFALVPDSRNVDHFTSFFQSDNHFFDNSVLLTVGAKLEHAEFTGYEFSAEYKGFMD